MLLSPGLINREVELVHSHDWVHCILITIYRTMYWTDSGFGRIEKASMDGTSMSTLHDSDLDGPTGLTLDVNYQILYWTDATRRVLERSNTDGTNRETLTSNTISSPAYLAYYDGYLYWSDGGLRYLLRTQVDSPNSVAYFSSYSRNNYGVQVISPYLQNQG